jgi:pimeloyl-ACP methyl ester carboxylesterase
VGPVTPPPVLLVHGFASSFERNWRETGWADLLGEGGRQVIQLDLPGHGGAEKSHDPMAYAGLEDAVLDALPAEGQVDAVGFSLGAGLLLAAAVQQPGRFAHLVVAGVGAGLFRDGDVEPLARAVETGAAGDGDSVAAQAFARFSTAPGNDPAALAACLRRPTNRLTPGMLHALTMPVLVVLGERDFGGPAGPLVEALPDGRLVTLAGADHFATPKDVRFLDAGLDFLGISF